MIKKLKFNKYRIKYLQLIGGDNLIYQAPYKRLTYYIDIKYTNDIYYKNELEKQLNQIGYIKSDKNNSSFIFLEDYESYPKQQKDEKYDNFIQRKHIYLTQFHNIKWINTLWGPLKEIITYKVQLHEHFKDKLNKYFIPWNVIRYENIDDDLQKISEGIKIVKENQSYMRVGTIIAKNKAEIKEHILKYQGKNLSINEFQIIAKQWIVEDYIQTDRIQDRSFYIRVHILIVYKTIGNNRQLQIYISNKQPCIFTKNDENCKSEEQLIKLNCVDTEDGSHLIKYIGGGVNKHTNKMGEPTIFNIDINPYWPKDIPENYNDKDIKNINDQIQDIFEIIFDDEYTKKFKPDFNSPNGYETFGCDISFQNKQVKLHEINRKTGLILQAPFISDIMKIINNDTNLINFNMLKKINL